MRNGLVEGVSLREVLRASGAMAPEAAAAVLSGTLLTLAVGHGDVCPEHVLVDASGGLTVTGFGGPDPDFTPDEPAYLAPERLAGGPSTPAADVFAATAVFFECLTGEPPFRAATAEDLNALHEYTQIIAEFAPAELRTLIQRGLTADPAGRPGDPHEFLAEVEATAAAAYGADWQARGRALLGGWATAVAAAEGAELAEPDEMPEPPPVGEPIDERLLGLGGGVDEDGEEEDEDDDDGLGPADDLLSAFDELAPHTEVYSETYSEPDLEAGESEIPLGLESAAEDLAEPVSEAEIADGAETETEAETEIEAETETEAAAEIEAEPSSVAVAEPGVEAAVETEAEVSLALAAEAEPAAESGIEAAGETEPESSLALATEPGTATEPAVELTTDPGAEPEPAPATTLLLDAAAEDVTKIVAPASAVEPLVPPSVQADIDHDWEIPSKPTPVVPRSLSAYANSLPSLPRPAVPEPEPEEPVATSAPDDWFRPGRAEPADRGPRPTRQTTFLDPDKESTTVAAAGFDEDFDRPEAGEEAGDPGGAGGPGGPRRKTLVSAVSAAVLLVAGAAAVVLGGSGNSGPAPAAQSSSGGATSDSPTGTDSVPATPTGTDNSSTLQTSSAGAPSSKHTTPHSTSKTTKPTGSGATSSTHSSSPSSTESSTSASSGGSSSDSSSPSTSATTSPTGESATPTLTKTTTGASHTSRPTSAATS